MPAGGCVRGVAQEANGSTAFRLVARLRANRRCIHAEGRSPAAGTHPGVAVRQTALARIAFQPMGLRASALRPLLLRWVAVRSLAFAPPPLRRLGLPRPALRSFVRLPPVALRPLGLRTGALRFLAPRATAPPRRSVSPCSEAGWSQSGFLFSVSSQSGPWHAAGSPHSALSLSAPPDSVSPLSGLLQCDSSGSGRVVGLRLVGSVRSPQKRSAAGNRTRALLFCRASASPLGYRT